jgi:lipopolysaccharide transport system ATP-binding protein
MNVIEIEKISKQYRLGKIETGTLKDDLSLAWANLLGKKNPFLELGDENIRDSNIKSKYVWALKDISFSVEQGEVLGIIGKNGAGKSTLLKILSRVTSPSTGSIRVKGRIASLLEVGTGFHPDLTGRENIFLNGAILGMSRREVLSKFDEIVAFSGVEKYIDTPVKRYSSGMYVRLAFAVAAHLEPEILIIDEVLAVGDAEFQKKCLGKMKDVSGQGRTVLFVSHNIHAIKSLCQKGAYLKNGTLEMIGPIQPVVEKYLTDSKIAQETVAYDAIKPNATAYLNHAICANSTGAECYKFSTDEDILIKLWIKKPSTVRGIYGHITIKNSEEVIILETDTTEKEENVLDTVKVGEFESEIRIPKRILKTGIYYANLGLASPQNTKFQIESLNSFLKFEVTAGKTERDEHRVAILPIILDWNIRLNEF